MASYINYTSSADIYHKVSAMRLNKKCIPFVTANDTDKWVLCVDGYIGVFEEKRPAEIAYEFIDDIDSSSFGCIQLLPPHYVPKDYRGNVMTKCLVSECQPIDIRGYIVKSNDRARKNMQTETPTLKERFWRFLNQDCGVFNFDNFDYFGSESDTNRRVNDAFRNVS